ncbi:MAG: flagellar biosynthesis anti-sigma factor FlgM [Deltaproteobacteria bacterium]|nr:flagellar biosynthesis anti-sigma factor FlgM [Deltaproteobacteria bacterium]HEN21209.1 flagellar biosynthesis anti-sigma factor FlgM [Desulfobacteraceae bacterium]
MKIVGENPFVKLDSYVKNIKQKKDVDEPKNSTSREDSTDDNVVLSPRAKEIQDAKKILISSQDIREEKIAEIRKQIENGTYQINGDKIAVKMIKESILNELL